ncbi:MAG: MBL fold metallo-hydrolase [Candidatus Thorarchaeota archaeon]
MPVTIKLLAHAGFQIKTDSKVIYVDLEKGADPKEMADIILATHSHSDHCDPAKINRVRHDNTVIIAPADCHSKIGGTIRSLKPGEKTTIGDITISAVEAYNETRFRSPGQPFHPKGLGVGYIITVEGKKIYHAGDTDFISEMKELGPVDVALLPVGGTYTMETDDGADAALAINPKVVIPMHTWDKDVSSFKNKIEKSSNISVIILEKEGEFTLS